MWIQDTDAFWLMLIVSCLGLTSLVLARLGEHSLLARFYRQVFFVSLSLVGLATMTSLASGAFDWVIGGTTLSIMLVGAILDPTQIPRDATI